MPVLALAINASRAVAGGARFTAAAGGVSKAAAKAAGAVAGLTVALAGLKILQELTRALAEFEIALVGVGKTTDTTGRELQEFGQRIVRLSETVPIATNELLKISEVAGQLGIRGAPNLLRFTETVAKLTRTTDLGGQAASLALARLQTIASESVRDVDRLGAAIVFLGNNFAATESEIVEVGLKIGQATSSFGLASEETLALAAAVRQLGGQSELAGSAVFRALSEISRSLRQNDERVQRITRLTGVSAEEFAKQFSDSPVTALTTFLRAMQEADKAGADLRTTLASFGVDSVRDARILGALAQRVDEVERALTGARKATKENLELNREFSQFSDTLAGDLQRLANNTLGLAVDFGDAGLTAAIRQFIQTINEGVNFLRSFEDTISSIGVTADVVFTTMQVAAVSAFGGISAGLIILENELKKFRLNIEGVFRAARLVFRTFDEGLFGVGGPGAAAGKASPVETLNRLIAGFKEFRTILQAQTGLDTSELGELVETYQQTIETLAQIGKDAFDRRFEAPFRGASSGFPTVGPFPNTLTQDQEGVLLAEVNQRLNESVQLQAASTRQRRIQLEIARQTKIVQDEIASSGGEFTDELKEQIKLSVIRTDNVKSALSALQEFSDGVANIIAERLTDVILGLEDLRDAAEAILQDIVRLGIQIAIRNAVGGLLGGGIGALGGGFGSAQGNAFGTGARVIPFQRGGVVERFGAFALGNGSIGTIAERGPEAIVPLRRDSQGNLGVAGGGNVTVNVFARDADSFRKSERQVAQAARRALRGAS